MDDMINSLAILKVIERQCWDLHAKLRIERIILEKELKDRLDKGLSGIDAIRHYNEWMQRRNLDHLVVDIDDDV